MNEKLKSPTVEGVKIKQTDDLLGEVLDGRYEVLELVGKGAMGSLYLGRHVALERPVAIKFLHAELAADDVHMERFSREAKMAASLQHGNVVHVYDVGNASDGSPYLVMDFLDGKSLAAILKDVGPVPLRRALPLITQVAQGLAYAHSKGLLHRDMKLSNVMVVREGAGECAKIIDFGIAKSVTEEQAQQLTATGVVFGSPLYMSPEQCQGYKLDPRSDIYSLGCVMYEMLTGCAPLKGDNLVATIYKHLHERPKSFAEVAPDVKVDEAMERIVFKALEKEPEKRYQSADELVDDLQKLALSCSAQMSTASTGMEEQRRASMVPSDESARTGKNSFALILVVSFLLAGAVVAYVVAQNKNGIPHEQPTSSQGTVTGKVNDQGVPIVAEYVVDGKKIQFTKDDYNGDDSKPFVWNNPAAANQPAEVLMFYAHQTSNQPRSFDMNYEIPGEATVNISAAHNKKPVYVVLSGYAPISWTIKADPSVNIKKVILSGYHQQRLAGGVASTVPVVESSDNQPPDRSERKNNTFKPFGGSMPSYSEGEDPLANSYFLPIKEEVKKQSDGNDISTLVEYGQTHQFDI